MYHFLWNFVKPVVEPLTSDRASCNSVIIIMFSINLAFLLILSLWLCEIFFVWMSRTNNEYLPASNVSGRWARLSLVCLSEVLNGGSCQRLWEVKGRKNSLLTWSLLVESVRDTWCYFCEGSGGAATFPKAMLVLWHWKVSFFKAGSRRVSRIFTTGDSKKIVGF